MNEKRIRGISGSTLKLIALTTMIMDHIGALLIHPYATGGKMYLIYLILRCIGRLSFPIFCFMLVEGFTHTHNRAKYAVRLFLFALVSEIPYDLARFGRIYDFEEQNVFWELLIGFLAICAFEYIEKHEIDFIPKVLLKIMGVILPTIYFTYRVSRFFLDIGSQLNKNILYTLVGAGILTIIICLISRFRDNDFLRNRIFAYLFVLSFVMLVADLIKCDYTSGGILLIAILFFLRKDNMLAMIYGNVSLILLLTTPLQIPALLAVPIVNKYNGTRGLNLKYVFYLFYPVHMVLLYFVEKALGLM